MPRPARRPRAPRRVPGRELCPAAVRHSDVPLHPRGLPRPPGPGLRVFPFSGADLSMPCLLVRSQGWVSLAATEAVRGEKRVDTGA